jgi:hypothetical protein
MSISSFLLCCRCAFWDGNLIQPKGLGLMDAFATGCGFNWINSKPGQCNSCKEQWKISIVSSKLVACWGDDQSIHHIQFDVEVTVVNKICLLIRTMEMKPQNTKSGLCYNTPSSQSSKCNNKQHVDHPVSPQLQSKNKIQNPFCHTHERWKARCNSTYKPVTSSRVWWASLYASMALKRHV